MRSRNKKIIGSVAIIFFLMLVAVGTYFVVDRFLDLNSLPIVGKKILVIPVKGQITMEGCSGSILTGTPQCARVDSIKNRLEQADNTKEIRAVVLEINSGGGGVTASRELMEAVRETNKPVVAHIGELGASGAYYTASAADEVVAYEDSLTGSIGVIMTVQHYYELYDKLGINVTVIKGGDNKDIGSPYRPMKEDEREELKDMVDKLHENFVRDVAENRNLSYEYAKNISDGSIYLGSEAHSLGLVDAMGDMDDAIEKAKQLGGINGNADVVYVVNRRENLFDIFNFNSNNIISKLIGLI